jgi:hypothetical protein
VLIAAPAPSQQRITDIEERRPVALARQDRARGTQDIERSHCGGPSRAAPRLSSGGNAMIYLENCD